MMIDSELMRPTSIGKFTKQVALNAPAEIDVSPFAIEEVLYCLDLIDPNTQAPTKLAEQNGLPDNENLVASIVYAADAYESMMIYYSCSLMVSAELSKAPNGDWKKQYQNISDAGQAKAKTLVNKYGLAYVDAYNRLKH